MSFIHKYGSSSCDASCGQNLLPPGKQDLPEKDVLPVSKQLVLTLISNATELPVPGAEVNLTSASTFFHAWSSASGLVHWEERWGRGNVSLEVFVSAQGFIASQHQLELPCPRNIDQPCLYNRTLRLYPVPPAEQDKENLTCSSAELSLVVIDSSGRKLPGVDILLTLVSNDTNSTTGHYINNVNGTSSLETKVGDAASDAGGSFSCQSPSMAIIVLVWKRKIGRTRSWKQTYQTAPQKCLRSLWRR